MILINDQTGEEHSLSSQVELLIGTPVNTLTLKKTTPVIPETFTLHQNFPNPFDPITTLSYDLPKDSDVRLAVFDILGNEVPPWLAPANKQASGQSSGMPQTQWAGK